MCKAIKSEKCLTKKKQNLITAQKNFCKKVVAPKLISFKDFVFSEEYYSAILQNSIGFQILSLDHSVHPTISALHELFVICVI